MEFSWKTERLADCVLVYRFVIGMYIRVQGIFEPVTLGNHILGPWKMIPHPLNETSWLSTIEPQENIKLPAFYKTQFTLPDNSTNRLDTYLDTTGWKKVCTRPSNLLDRNEL